MSAAEIFAYGAAGAVFGAFVVQLMPVGFALAYKKVALDLDFGSVVGILIILVGFAGLGGLAALGVGNADNVTNVTRPAQAVAYGLGWQGLLGGLLAGLLKI
jgi:hypothetical protein